MGRAFQYSECPLKPRSKDMILSKRPKRTARRWRWWGLCIRLIPWSARLKRWWSRCFASRRTTALRLSVRCPSINVSGRVYLTSKTAEVSATEQTFGWLAQEVARRNPEAAKPILLLMDGQKSLWDAGQRVLPQVSTIENLDLLHATPRIWDAAHLFYGGDEEQALSFVYDRVLRLLKGEVPSVVAGLRQMGTKR